MILDKFKVIRTKKRIARKKMAILCDVPEQLISYLEEHTVEETINQYPTIDILNIIDRICKILKVNISDLSSDYNKSSDKRLNIKVEENLNILNNLNIIDIFKSVLNKYDLCNIPKNNLALKVIEEFMYYATEYINSVNEVHELSKDIATQREDSYKIVSALLDKINCNKQDDNIQHNDIDESSNTSQIDYDGYNDFEEDLIKGNVLFLKDKQLGFDDKLIDGVRKDARIASIIYKELRINGLSPEIACNVLTAILQSNN